MGRPAAATGRRRRRLGALALIALIGAGCSNPPATVTGTSAHATGAGTASSGNNTGTNDSATNLQKAVKFAQCMRANGVSQFPDPNSSGQLTIDGIANGTSLDPSSPAFQQALGACKDLEPPGFMGTKRTAQQQEAALKFAQCMRDNGVKDFPDPAPDGPLIDTNRIPSLAGKHPGSVPGFTAAKDKCSALYSGELGLRGR